MADIYDQHRAAFAQVSAFVIMLGNERVATVAFKFPRDGAGRLYAYVHWIGIEMVRGHAGGYGYDKRSAAVTDAARKIGRFDAKEEIARCHAAAKPLAAQAAEMGAIAKNEALTPFIEALDGRDGNDWDRRLRDAGFTVYHAV